MNIGGGAFSYPGWVNLDQRKDGFTFTPSVVFPFEDKSVEYVYSSHCLEHLNDETVDRVLSEARRICKGNLVLKLPDFEQVLERWKAGDEAYFDGWGMGSVYKTWASRGVKVDIDSKASMIFCGFWNEAYGDEWGNRNPNAVGAYHGPVAPMPHHPDTANSPHRLSVALKSFAPDGAVFNHQNAWSREELKSLLAKHGFEVTSMEQEEVCKEPIPTINEMRGISMYALAH